MAHVADQLAVLKDGDQVNVRFRWGQAEGRVIEGDKQRLWLHVDDCVAGDHLIRHVNGEPHRLVTGIKQIGRREFRWGRLQRLPV